MKETSQNPLLQDALYAYIKHYWPEHNWDGIAFDAELTGDIVVVNDTAGIKPMFGQKAFVKFLFDHPECL